jgi:hypothetical protein
VSARRVIAALAGVYLLGMGFLGGTIVSAMRFDGRREAILSQLSHDSARARGILMRLERDAVRTAAVR